VVKKYGNGFYEQRYHKEEYDYHKSRGDYEYKRFPGRKSQELFQDVVADEVSQEKIKFLVLSEREEDRR